MKILGLFFLTFLNLFAYSDCCEMISNNFNPEEIQQNDKNSSGSYSYDYISGENEFINFSADKAWNYSNTGTSTESTATQTITTQRMIPLTPTDDKGLEQMIEEERTVE